MPRARNWSLCPPRSVLIVMHGAIGDVARALPLAIRLKKAWPKTVIAWAVEPAASELVLGHEAIDRVHIFNRREGLRAFIKFIREIRSEKGSEKYELVLDLQRHFKSGVVSFFSGAEYRIGFNRKNSREVNWLFNNYHIPAQEHFSLKSKQYQVFGDVLGLPPVDFKDAWLKADYAASLSLKSKISNENQNKLYGLLIGSTWESRFWTVENYILLVRNLFEKYGLIAVLVGNSELEKSYSLKIKQAAQEGAVINLVGKTSLKELIALFSEVKFAVGVDSGPMHMAAACCLPVISLWGSTSPLRSAPIGSESYVVQVPVPCGPCYKEKCIGYDMRCMKLITPEMVVTKAESLLVNKLQVNISL